MGCHYPTTHGFNSIFLENKLQPFRNVLSGYLLMNIKDFTST